MAQDGAGELGEEALDEVEPGAMRGREGEFEAMCRLLRDGLATGHAHQAWNRVFGCWRRCAPATKSPVATLSRLRKIFVHYKLFELGNLAFALTFAVRGAPIRGPFLATGHLN